MAIRRLFALIIILILSTQSTSFVLAKPNNSTSPEDLAQEFLCAKMNSLVSKNVDAIDKYYYSKSLNSQKYKLFTKQELLQDYLISYASNDYEIKKVSPKVQIIFSTINGDTATVEAILKTDIYWNSSNALGKPIVGRKAEKHILSLYYENNNWKIVADQYLTSRGNSDSFINEDFSRLIDTTEKLKIEAKDTLNRTKRSKPSRLTFGIDENVVQNRVAASTSYNRNAAYNWALTYWDNPSKEFVNLGDQKWEGGDCTNFVSQCLRAGGANNDKTGSYQWFYDSDNSYSWTWSTATGLNYILLGNYKANEFGPKGTEKVITGDVEYSSFIGQYMKLGDIIQYQWKPTKKITHSAIIVGMLFNSSKERYEPVIAEHTNNSWYTPWTNNAYKTYFVHIESIN